MLRKSLKNHLSFLIGISSLFFLLLIIGCGGGGGGSGGAGVDPIEVEVKAALSEFLVAVSSRDLPGAMNRIDSNLQYWRANSPNVQGYGEFETRLGNFIGKVSSITVTIENPGVSPNGETSAVLRGTLHCLYVDNSSAPRDLTENCELVFERVSKWGIRTLSGFNLSGLNFPPEL